MKPVAMNQLIERLTRFSNREALLGYLRSHRSDITPEVVADLKKRVDQLIRVDGHAALKMADVTLQTARVIREPLSQGLGLRAKAQVLHVLGSYEKALTFYDQALRVYREQGNELDAAKVKRAQVDALIY